MRGWHAAIVLLAASAATAAQAPGHTRGGPSLKEIFESANIAASRGDYTSAISSYQMLDEAGVRDRDVYFNLATSFARSGEFARAILNYERALRLHPNDPNVTQNLRRAEKALEEQRAEAEGEAMIQRSNSISEAVYRTFTEDALAYGLLVADLLFFVCLAWLSFRRRGSAWLYVISISSGVALAFFALGIGAKAGLLREGPRAVVLDDRVVLREAPDPRAQARSEARGGDRGEVVDRDGDFVRFRMANGLEGWARESEVGLIDPEDGVH